MAMVKFAHFFVSLFYIIFKFPNIMYLCGKYRIFTYPSHFKINFFLKVLLNFLSVLFYPTSFVKPDESFGQRVTMFLESLGPVYIKFGQMLSTRPDIVGEEIAHSLSSLQDKLPEFSYETANKIIFNSFGQNTNELFLEFSEKPVAAASIAQVHKAKLKTGEDVAVKILRPNIYQKYLDDIVFLHSVALVFDCLSKRARQLKFEEVIESFQSYMKVELDLRLEGAAASELADYSSGDDYIYVPKIYWDYTSEMILTTEWINGISIYDKKALIEAGFDLKDIASKVAILSFNQTYRDGFFHADLHPGNIFVLDNGKIALIDFGIMGRLSYKDRIAIADVLYGFLKRDYLHIAKIHVKVGYVPKNTDIYLFAQACRSVGESIVGVQANKISIGKLLSQLIKINEDFNMNTQPQLVILQKTILVVEGIGQMLDPEINMWVLVEKWIAKWGIRNLSLDAKISYLIKNEIEKLIYNL
jgi:ubiquinone biosynthesis protein